MAQKKKTTRQTKTEREFEQQKKQNRQNNLIVIVLFVVAAFVALSVYFCIAQLGWLADAGKGLLGVSVYLLPIALIYIGVNMILPEKRVATKYKVASSIAILMVVGMAFYLFSDEMYTKTLDLPLLWTGSVGLKAGGVIEGLVAVPLIMIISRWGLGIILAAVTLFAVLSITDRTLYDVFVALRRLIKKDKPETDEAEEKEAEEWKNDFPTPPPAFPVKDVVDVSVDDNPVDIPIETYEVESDGLDDDGQPINLPVTPAPAHHTVPITGVEAFTYDDINPEHNIDPAEIGSAEAVATKTTEIADAPLKEAEEMQFPEPDEPAEQMPLYVFPPVNLLQKAKYKAGTSKSEIEYNSKKLIETLHDFGVEAKMLGASIGPNVTRYELQPKAGIKVSKITGLSDDIALSLAATQVRIEAPIPGKAAVGIEIPNQSASTVYIRDLIDSEDFSQAQSPLTVALGKDISGKNIYADLSKMPHLLVAGTTGSGKSVCINSILLSLLYKASPEDLKLILIDPKVIELNVYNKIPHLFIPVVTDPKKAAGALQWACSEMDRRYNLFTEFGTRDIGSYNAAVAESTDENARPLPRIVVIIDELADLMMVASKEVEEYICRLCQKARAAGIFLIIATQSPRVDVVTGLIKANVPSRIAFAVSSGIDSRVILDTVGAEKLLGKGDMLYFPIGANKPRRIQGCFVSDSEVEKVVGFIRNNVGDADYDNSAIQKIEEMSRPDSKGASAASDGDDEDEMLMPAIECVVEAGMASTSFLQRKLKLGYSRAARIIDIMEEMGVVGPFEGSKPRTVKMTMSELQEMKLQRGAKE